MVKSSKIIHTNASIHLKGGLKMFRCEKEYYNIAKRGLENNKLMKKEIKTEKMEKLKKIYTYRSRECITMDEFMRLVSEI